ncbi:MAG: hypothetical protein H7Z42_19865 [Roseiflexaceae bacterium]|nr:hypothetical protein [Roseiflexaceae bacterium]
MNMKVRPLVLVGSVCLIAVVAWAIAVRPQPPRSEDMAATPAQQVLRGRPSDAAAQQRHLAVVTQVAPPPQRVGATMVAPIVETITSDEGVTSFVTIPLVWASGGEPAAQLEQAKQQLAVVVNQLFASDPALERIGLIGTYPQADGSESPAIFAVVAQAQWRQYQALDGATLNEAAQSFRIASELTQ